VTATIVTLAERPELTSAMWTMPNTLPPFMNEDPVAEQFFGRLPDEFADCQLVAVDERAQVIGKLNSLPFVWTGADDDLPDRGWDAVLERGFADKAAGRGPNAVSLLEARVVPDHRGHGLSRQLLEAARANVRSLGIADLFAPVRPTGKEDEPRTPMTDYVARTRADGLPSDAWLRTHARLGARIVKVCPLSMTIPGTLPQWRAWTGLPLTESGVFDVPGALVPIYVSVEQNHAVYVEPNVWLHHSLN
jgi:GNAT superfamily N-acetyltransferase